eukprot:gene945-1272_t
MGWYSGSPAFWPSTTAAMRSNVARTWASVNVFTKIQLALFAAGPWSVVPTLPVELILLPRWFPVHLSKMSYWARTVIVPLLVLAALKPVARNESGVKVDELYIGKQARLVSKAADTKRGWTMFFNGLDKVLKLVEPLWPRGTRQRAIQACVDFVTERLNGEDGLGAIYPAMANSVMMFDCLGYAPDHPHRAIARTSVEKLLVVGEDIGQPAGIRRRAVGLAVARNGRAADRAEGGDAAEPDQLHDPGRGEGR